ncbi:hypothetical protein RM780_19425 [Streptomyces sp. DSM 44917]|uniref:Uncharacterized protein n=1 Tax=Streptomyces boetiae TaxID=3075541 RepID=A0ABU2LC19_9ACTN|nr:hypothetical protein [Streptomyces sp. DSM 44917]MDT0309115.1 hypothetical protein [Streptomyces sp. DSM 44917]
MLGALGGAALLAAGTGACQVIEGARAGHAVSGAVDELTKWEAVTATATVDATPEQVYDYLRRADERQGREGPRATPGEARLLSDLELTVSVGDPEGDTRLRDLEEGAALDGAMTLNFGGRDVAGVKQLAGDTYVRVGGQAVVEDVYGGGEAAVARAERFERDAARLPESLGSAAAALRGDWVRVDPFAYEGYAEALAEEAGVPPATAAALAAALTDGGALLTPEALWAWTDGLESTLRSGATLDRRGEERGAERVDVTLPAGEAQRAAGPLLALLDEQSERFGLPPLAGEPADPAGPVTLELTIRNGVLTDVGFDLAQFAPGGAEGEAGSLPLNLRLNGGSALNLDPPEEPAEALSPEDLTVALLYLAEQNERRAEDEDRADVPGPMQP